MKTVILGTTLAAIRAALALREERHDVLMICTGTYLGEELTATWQLYGREEEQRLAEALRTAGIAEKDGLTPARVKRLLLERVLQAGIELRYMTRLAGVLARGNTLCGVLLADRYGLHRVDCDAALDGTPDRQAFATVTGVKATARRGARMTIAAEIIHTAGGAPERIGDIRLIPGKMGAEHFIARREVTLPQALDDAERTRFAAEETERMLTEVLHAPGMQGARPGSALPQAWTLTENGDGERPEIQGLFGCEEAVCPPKADPHAEMLFITGGRRIPCGEDGLPTDERALRSEKTDLFVAGCGPAGVWAALGAAREGLHVTAAELFAYPGGTRTLGGVAGLYCGNRNGYFLDMWKELTEYERRVTGGIDSRGRQTLEILFYMQAMKDAGVSYCPHTICCAARRDEKGNVASVLAATPEGLVRYEAESFIDATGDGGLAALCGAELRRGDERTHAMQNYSQWNRCAPDRRGRQSIDQDTMDPWEPQEWNRALAYNLAHGEEYDLFDMLTPRESGRIQGRTTVTLEDVMREKRTADILYEGYSTYDPHGRCLTLAGRMGFMPALGMARFVAIPRDALLLPGCGNLLVNGKAISMDQDAFNYIRMNSDVMTVGYLSGRICALAHRCAMPVESAPLASLQQEALEQGAITCPPPEKTTYGKTARRVAAALLGAEDPRALADGILCNYPEVAPIVHEAVERGAMPDTLQARLLLLWYGDLWKAAAVCDELKKLDAQQGCISYVDRQRATGVIRGGVVDTVDAYWRMNQMAVALAKAGYTDAIPVIEALLAHTQPGGGWVNDASTYASIRLDCQTVPNYDRILCLAQACVMMPDTSFTAHLERIYGELEALEQPKAQFYKQYLLLALAQGIFLCGGERERLEALTRSAYATIATAARHFLKDMLPRA